MSASSASPSPLSRWNPWPAGIIAVFTLFVSGTVALIVVACGRRSELVASDYYEQEVHYQARVDQLRRTAPWDSRVAVAMHPEGRQMEIVLPREHAAAGVTGNLQFYRPAELGRDRRVALAVDADGRQVLATDDMVAGLWRVRVEWSAGGESFFAERRLVIPEARTPLQGPRS